MVVAPGDRRAFSVEHAPLRLAPLDHLLSAKEIGPLRSPSEANSADENSLSIDSDRGRLNAGGHFISRGFSWRQPFGRKTRASRLSELHYERWERG